jgi:hypothetical protein
MLTVVPDVSVSLPADGPSSLIDQIVREGARQMLAAALRAEVAAYIDQFAGVSAQRRWRMVNAPHLVALVRAGATFVNGKLAERPGEDAQPEAA